MSISYEEFTSRNVGLVANQDALKQARVAVAGCGGAGGAAAITLARMGLGAIRVADPDDFDATNLNRQWGASLQSVGTNKSEVLAAELVRTSPFCSVETYPDGITDSNVEGFCQGADLIIEAIDYWAAVPTVMLQRTARSLGIPVLTAVPVGWSSNLLLFEPTSMTFEEYIGRNHTDDLSSFAVGTYPLEAYCPEPPEYVAPELLMSIATGQTDIPVVSTSVNLAGAMLAAFAYFRISGARDLKPAPYFYSASDLMTLQPRKL